ncbi:dnaJ protein homolog 1-like isoform X2 [Dermacentor silvarum]|uniref:dnaJ protein homolog 1-like isoform X2 n=1 Tax=Dermacentor silvarum TaxID=543639 RepID=UPI0021016318|nr:dnaJ protein homolog 1-like isoform X2 [Dermacentor silvarum]
MRKRIWAEGTNRELRTLQQDWTPKETMVKDYYHILGIGKDASKNDVVEAYRKLACKYHPDINKSPEAAGKFKEIDEAFEVLSDKKKRDFYDRIGSRTGATERHQEPTIYYDVPVSLEEVYNGCTKKIKITRTVTGPDGQTPKPESKLFDIKVKPGWKEGTKVRFHGEGDQLPNTIPADVVFIIRDKPHPYFKRDGADVLYVAKITFKEALRGTTLEVPTLTHGTISVPLTDIVKPTTVKRIPGQGLRRSDDTSTRGDLLLSFDIQYPCKMTDTALRILWDTLDPLV